MATRSRMRRDGPDLIGFYPIWDIIPAMSISDPIRAEIAPRELTAYAVAKPAGLTSNAGERLEPLRRAPAGPARHRLPLAS